MRHVERRPTPGAATRRTAGFLGIALGLALAVALGAGCGEDDPIRPGDGLRTPPDTLRITRLTQTVADTVFPVPVSLGKSPVGQIGSRIAYTTHVLIAFRVPTFTVDAGDTLRLDEANLSIPLDSLATPPYSGNMNLRLAELAPEARGWDPDSLQGGLPPLRPVTIADPLVVSGDGLVGSAAPLLFTLDLPTLADFDSTRARGDSLDVHVAVLFAGFDAGDGPGFLEFPWQRSGNEAVVLNGFSNADPSNAIFTSAAVRRVTLVEFDSTFSRRGHLVVSDGYRMHTYLKFASLASVLPESAVVFRADLLLRQVETADGTVFGTGPEFGVVVPTDTTMLFSEEQNTRSLAFQSPLVADAGAEVSINVTAYVFDIQEGAVDNRGMLLRLSNEGTKVRHFEFYGPTASDSTRPRLRIVYALPADFGGGEVP